MTTPRILAILAPGVLGLAALLAPTPSRAQPAPPPVPPAPIAPAPVVDAPPVATTTSDAAAIAQPAPPAPPPARMPFYTTRCLLSAGARDDIPYCLYRPSPTLETSLDPGPAYRGYVALGVLFARNTMDLISRWDDVDMDVVTPVLAAAIESPTGRWGASASMLVDVAPTPAVDVVSTALPVSREVRYAPSLGGHLRFGDVDLDVHGAVSHKPDDVAVSAGGGILVDLRRRTIVPSLDFTYTHEISGSLGTPYSLLSHGIDRYALEARTAFVIDDADVLEPSLTVVLEVGDTSSVYRRIPLFSPDAAPMVQPGASMDLVNATALMARPLEQLPTNRQRFVLGGVFEHRFSWSTLRAEERVYLDSWGQKASDTFAELLVELGERVLLWPEASAHVQTGADFWRLAYVGAVTSAGMVTFPALRAGRLDLGPLAGATGGAGVRVALDEKKRFSFTVNGDVVYTRFLDHLSLLEKLGYAGATTLEARFR
jgi:hypothetical protein